MSHARLHSTFMYRLRAIEREIFKHKKNNFFCRSGYDHILLQSYLVPHLFESRCRPKLEKRGNKVSAIRTNVGVHFRDATKLLSPSTNLRSFGKLFNLEQVKAHFPFGILRSVNVLQDKELPRDPRLWKSDLTGNDPITEAEIEEAHQLFVKTGCQCLGDYLTTYLKLDVVILYKAMQEWRLSLKNLVHLDFVENNRYTIAGFSNLAGLKLAAKNKRFGIFFPNNSQIYRLLRRGMRG